MIHARADALALLVQVFGDLPPRGGVSGPDDEDEVEYWAETLRTGDAAERRQAVRMLAGMGQVAARAVPALAAALHDDNPRVRRRAVKALADLGPSAREALPDLVAVLREGEESLRFWAVFALGEVGPAAAAATPALRRILREAEGARLRAVVKAALKKIAAGATHHQSFDVRGRT